MIWLSKLHSSVRERLRGLVFRRRAEAELDEELRSHLDMETEKLVRSRGLAPDEARRQAAVTFGGLERYKEEVRDARGSDWVSSGIVPRSALRSLRRSPWFATTVVLTIALGVGVTTAVLSVTDHVLIRGLPFRESGRLMMMLERDQQGALRIPSYPTVDDWRRDPGAEQAFEGLTFVRADGVRVRTNEHEETVGSAFVSPDFFPLVGSRVALGRLPVRDDYAAGAEPVAVLSHRLWMRIFRGDLTIVGQSISIDSVPTTVVGVLANGAVYPTFAEVWLPLEHFRRPEALERRGLHADSRTVARLRSGVDSARAVAIMRTVGLRLGAAHPLEQEGWAPDMRPLQQEIIGDIRPMLVALTAAAMAVLLLVCANVASLLLARLTTRTQEIAVRTALGASRGRIMMQLIAEGVVLAVVGGVLGTALGAACIAAARSGFATRLPRAEELVIDHRVLAIAVAATVLTALLSSIWPAIRATRHHGGFGLRAITLGSVGIRSDSRLRRVLVTAQFAVALVLAAGAGLLVQSFRRAAAVNLGFDHSGIITLIVRPPSGAYPEPKDAAALYTRLMDETRSIPGIIDAAFINHAPFGTASITTTLSIEDRDALGASNQVLYRTVSAEYLETMRMSMVSGRWFDKSDMQSPDGRFVINETMARQYWPASAVGQRIGITRASQARPDFGKVLSGTVVGVVADVHQRSTDVAPTAEVYVPYTLETWPWGTIVARTSSAASAIPAMRRAVQAVDPRLIADGPAGDAAFGVMESSVATTLAPRRFSMSLIAAFAACALLLAATGLYGIIAHDVSQRTREFGIRKALGATDRSILSLVLRDVLPIFATGMVVGSVGSWAAAQLVRALLFETGVADPVAYLGTIAILVGIAVLAAYLPARHAIRLSPAVALRAE